jgi:SAM-dependent methyltransferase
VVAAVGEPPTDIGTGHLMRGITEQVAADPASWTPELAARVADFFDELAPGWQAETSARSQVALLDLLSRAAGSLVAPVVELGAGTGAGTAALAAQVDHVVAGDLSAEMLQRLPAALASRVRLDAAALPLRARSVGTLVCANMFLFADEVRRVLTDDGSLIWVNSIGERTPIHLSAEQVADALGDGFEVTASRAGWGTWAVARRVG